MRASSIRRFPSLPLILLALTLISLVRDSSHAQNRGIPNAIAYQGVLLEKNNRPKPDGTYQFTFEMFDAANTSVWKSAVQTLPVRNGSFTTILGPFDPTVGFDKPYLLEITVNGEVLAPRMALLSSPYSFGIADSAVTSAKILSSAVTESKIADQAVTTTKIGLGAVTSDRIRDGAITTIKLADGSVTEPKLADGAVDNRKIAIGTITGDRIANGTITGLNVAANTITGSNIALSTITGANVVPNSLGSNEIADNVDFSSIRIIGNNGIPVVWLTTSVSSGGNYLGGGVFVYAPAGPIGNGNNYATGLLGDGTKKFIMRDPTNAGRLINYTCLEGPEAAVYVRGKAHLEHGVATITLPPYFSCIAVDSSITVALTPRSIDSRGLAVVKSTSSEVVIQELMHGDGSYDFDYTVSGVRRGFEDYQVYTYPDKDGNYPGGLDGFSAHPRDSHNAR